MTQILCNTSDITDPGSRGFLLVINGEENNLFVVHRDGEFYAYINSCPHTGAPLEWLEHRFLDIENNFIQCSNHSALFEINSGNCISGPCAGDQLTPVRLDIKDGMLFAILP